MFAMQSRAIANNIPVPNTNTLTGSIAVWDALISVPYGQHWQHGNLCATDRGFQDIHEGQSVLVRDAKNNIIAIGKLKEGRFNWVNKNQYPALWTCIFGFSVSNIPESPFYTLTIGGRKPIAITLDDLKLNKWTLNFSLRG